ncbi:AAA family ATPase [Succinimonas sp.]|uniref:AAA family ATPase n=1 Tax=Succinimonas sp. TaxID=1936151 RepID=UPI0038685562
MNKHWSLEVSEFGKINYAKIRIHNFICFVGDNNSGKSYIMSLLWGILTSGRDVFLNADLSSPCYKRCEEWLLSHMNKEISFSDEIACFYVDWFNELLDNNKDVIVQRIFYRNIPIKYLKISDYCLHETAKLSWTDSGNKVFASNDGFKVPVMDAKDITSAEIYDINACICWNLLMQGLAAPWLAPAVNGRRNGEPVYFPASRTGLMLSYPLLAEKARQKTFADYDGEPEALLTQPHTDFLKLILQFDNAEQLNSSDAEIVNFIQNELLNGDIVLRNDDIPVLRYKPKDSAFELPLVASSSLIAEISPLLLLLKSKVPFKTIIIEEPEAHLHLAMQQKIARLLINMANAGYNVWITTYSDTIMQHINNMCSLSMRKNKDQLMAKHFYAGKDLLTSEQIAVYQFTMADNAVTVEELENYNGCGFAVSSVNDAIAKISAEVYEFQGAEE